MSTPNLPVLSSPESRLTLTSGALVISGILLCLTLKLGPALLSTLALITIGLKLQGLLARTPLHRLLISWLCAAVLLLLLTGAVALGSTTIQFVATKAQLMLPDFLEQLRGVARRSSIEALRSLGDLDNQEMVEHIKQWAAGQASLWMAMTGGSLKFMAQVFFAGLISVSLIVRGADTIHVRPGLSGGLIREGERFLDCFSTLLTAQLYVSLWNTSVTAIYIYIVLPLLGVDLPLREAVLLATLLLSFIPALGNVLANSLMVVLCLQFPPWVLVLSLIYLISVHKMEYLINARVLSSAYQASVAELLVCIVLGETLFGLPGLIILPVTYLYLKDVLKREHIW
jgi:predicted PurR-regulated permease PerM